MHMINIWQKILVFIAIFHYNGDSQWVVGGLILLPRGNGHCLETFLLLELEGGGANGIWDAGKFPT